jgi:hypothetical protein
MKIAATIGGAIVIATMIAVYFSPFHTCKRDYAKAHPKAMPYAASKNCIR